MSNRDVSIHRAEELKSRIQDYLDYEQSIPTGFRNKDMIKDNKKKLLQLLGGTEEDWNDWRWQLKNRISDVDQLAKVINLTDEEKENIRLISEKYRWAISPYYVSIMEPHNPDCAVRKQSVPSIVEMVEGGEADPMGEEFTSPVENITRRYPDRLIIKVTNQCAMYCRHCQRRRSIGQQDLATSKEELQACVDYVRDNPEVRDVLLTGGDALMIKDDILFWLLRELRQIPHLEIIRIGTRTPVTMPQRITKELCDELSKYHPLYLNTHFNSPSEITEEAAQATDLLTRAGIPLGNQAVLLKGINNHPYIMKKLNQELLRIRVKPYYIFHPKEVMGTGHFKVKIEEGLEIMENLRGFTSGMAIPTYIVNAPKGKGKTPLLPQYLLDIEDGRAKLRNWENEVFYYPN
ncbi:glutamate 2,3-aminomutase [Vallitalea okinawensis]|uniref:glutamate 2,3-aminomutase n=1 Tax=Vallitalea okinawensis TaxID=2078660 RepID=UPI000CFBF1EE|nr:glutamate 2,3-aminomutase [Vallitalea okinawensis]